MLIESTVGSFRSITDRMALARIRTVLLCLGLGVGLFGGRAFGQTPHPPAADPVLEAALKRLEPIPIFLITNSAGAPVVARVPNPRDKTKKMQVATFFTGHQDAQAMLKILKTKNPAIGKSAKIVAISLRDAYELNEKHKGKADALGFHLTAPQQQMDAGVAVLKQNGQDRKVFPGVPLFYATGGTAKALLTVTQGKKQIIPFCFSRQDLQAILDGLKHRDAHLYSTVKVEVTSLNQLFNKWATEKSTGPEELTLVPDRTSMQFVADMHKAAQDMHKAAGSTPHTKP